jgi:hypothetical protein
MPEEKKKQIKAALVVKKETAKKSPIAGLKMVPRKKTQELAERLLAETKKLSDKPDEQIAGLRRAIKLLQK